MCLCVRERKRQTMTHGPVVLTCQRNPAVSHDDNREGTESQLSQVVPWLTVLGRQMSIFLPSCQSVTQVALKHLICAPTSTSLCGSRNLHTTSVPGSVQYQNQAGDSAARAYPGFVSILAMSGFAEGGILLLPVIG